MSIHQGHRQRLKAEFLSGGAQSWSDYRLLELMLCFSIPQGDVNPLAHQLIDRFGSLAGVLDAPVEELCRVKGVGEHTAAYLKLFPAVNGRYLANRTDPGEVILTSEAAGKALAPYFYGAQNEMVYILCLDAKGKNLGACRISEGNQWGSEVNIQNIAVECVKRRCAYFYLAHNHVTNIALPSREDWSATSVVRSALLPLGITLLDHLVFVDGDMVSIKLSRRSGRAQVFRMLPLDDWDN